ncbi:MAG: TerC family protein [Limnochordales bacterium]|nr:TerC family protein [Limnochordales bacterium]
MAAVATSWWMWALFNLLVLGMLALDLGVFHRHSHVVKAKEAAIWTVVWIVVALIFGGFVYWWKGPDTAMEYLTGYLIEKSLSADNIFVFVLIFTYFAVPAQFQHRVLFWGVLGALVMRGIFIALGAALISKFSWIMYLFGAFLLFTGIKLLTQKEESIDPGQSPVLAFVRRLFPVTEGYEGNLFFVRRNGVLMATPLFVVLALVESSDVMFAVDSVPAIFAVTQDPFIVYTSNVFAILGLRSLYFLLADVLGKLRYLKYGLSLILAFVGTKMLLQGFVHVPPALSLGVIVAVLTVTIAASLLVPERETEAAAEVAIWRD